MKSVSSHDFEDVADNEYDAAVKGNHKYRYIFDISVELNTIQKNLSILTIFQLLNRWISRCTSTAGNRIHQNDGIYISGFRLLFSSNLITYCSKTSFLLNILFNFKIFI